MKNDATSYQMYFRPTEEMVSDRSVSSFVGLVEAPRGSLRHSTVGNIGLCAGGPGNNLREIYDVPGKAQAAGFFGGDIPADWDVDNFMRHAAWSLSTMGDTARCLYLRSDLPPSEPDRETFVIFGQMATKNMRVPSGCIHVFEGGSQTSDEKRFKGMIGREVNPSWEVPASISLMRSSFAKVLSAPVWGNHIQPHTAGPHFFSEDLSRGLKAAVTLISEGVEARDLPQPVLDALPDRYLALMMDENFTDRVRSIRDIDPDLVLVPFGPCSKADLIAYDDAHVQAAELKRGVPAL